MSISTWYQKNKNTAGPVLAIVLFAASGAIFAMTRSGVRHAPPARQAWFYDVGNGQLFAGPAYKKSPIPGQTAPDSGVEAAVFACGDCADAGQRKIALLTTHTLAVQELLGSTDPEFRRVNEGKINAGTRVAVPPVNAGDKIQWHALSSPEGAALAQKKTTCSSGAPVQCSP